MVNGGGDDEKSASAFTNPFDGLEHIDNGTMKLTDEPSTALLKMTFDLGVYRPQPRTIKSIARRNKKRDSVFISPDDGESPFEPSTTNNTTMPSSTSIPLSFLIKTFTKSRLSTGEDNNGGSTSSHQRDDAEEQF